MIELYLIFLIAACLLFAAIVGYSMLQKRRREAVAKTPTKEPLLTELEAQKRAEFARQERNLGQQSSTKQAYEPAQNSNAAVKSPPTMGEPAIQREEPVTEAPTSAEKSAENSAENQIAETDDTATDNKPITGAEGVLEAKLKQDSAGNIITELVAKINNPEAIEQQELLALLRLHDFKFHRKINLFGLNQMTERWCDIEFEQPSSRFVELGLSMQLADRNGAMSSKELHDFQQMTLAFTNKFDAPFDFSFDIDDAFKQAQILDEIGRRYDSMAVLNVVPRSKTGFRIADIESCAREMMMSPDKKGIFVKSTGHKSDLTVLYRLACTDGTGQFGVSSGGAKSARNMVHDLVIYMNVPATEQPDRVFQDMVKDANNLATWLEGKVVDRNSRVMTQRSYSILMQQISDIAYSMQQDGLTPGDAVSKKLF